MQNDKIESLREELDNLIEENGFDMSDENIIAKARKLEELIMS